MAVCMAEHMYIDTVFTYLLTVLVTSVSMDSCHFTWLVTLYSVLLDFLRLSWTSALAASMT